MKLLHNFLKDLKLSSKSFYFYMEIGFAVIIVLVLLFVIPENFESNMTIYTHIDVDASVENTVVKALEQSDDEYSFYNSREELEEALNDNRNSVGVTIYQEDEKVVYEFILQGYEDVKLKNILVTSIESAFASKVPGYVDNTYITTIDSNTEKLSDRVNILPVVLALNAAFMGLFIIASYIFLDKEEGTIKALAVTPSKMWHYLLGKVGVILVSGIISGLITVIPVAGLKVNYLHFMALLLATNLFGSALGLFIASFFDTMTKAMGWLYASVIVLAFAAISYYTPAFSPLLIKILPSYPMIFAFKQVFLEQPDVGFIYMNVGGFALAGVVFFILANYRFKKTLTI